MQINYSYTTVHYVIALLKAFGIKNIITSPGTQNAGFNLIVQEDPFFKCHSVVDERSAAYVASGIIDEIGEPVVITCTGATASRNYMSAMTEAFYRKLPIIALTFFNYASNPYVLAPQFLDRRITQNDIKTIDVELPRIFDERDKSKCLSFLNAALATAKYKNEPVHIKCPSILDFKKITRIKNLPEDIWSTDCLFDNFEPLKKELENKKVAVFIGSLSVFAKKHHAPIFCDHTSNYNGENKILITQVTAIKKIQNRADIVIDLGYICGDYSHHPLINSSEIWRVNDDFNFKFRDGYPVKHSFLCHEKSFFDKLNTLKISTKPYYEEIKKQLGEIRLPDDIPLSMPFIAYHLSKKLPKNCSLHVSILNALRGIDMFDFDKSISITCNVGGFGIDGAVSSLVGQSFNDANKMCFGLIGDLAFFYDMNILGNRDIKNNIRILCVNNNRGVEFSLSPMYAPILHKNSPHMAAAGHYKAGVKGWVESMGFEYMSAKNKEQFLNQIDDFCKKDCAKPIVFEVFTTNADELAGYYALNKF